MQSRLFLNIGSCSIIPENEPINPKQNRDVFYFIEIAYFHSVFSSRKMIPRLVTGLWLIKNSWFYLWCGGASGEDSSTWSQQGARLPTVVSQPFNLDHRHWESSTTGARLAYNTVVLSILSQPHQQVKWFFFSGVWMHHFKEEKKKKGGGGGE